MDKSKLSVIDRLEELELDYRKVSSLKVRMRTAKGKKSLSILADIIDGSIIILDRKR